MIVTCMLLIMLEMYDSLISQYSGIIHCVEMELQIQEKHVTNEVDVIMEMIVLTIHLSVLQNVDLV